MGNCVILQEENQTLIAVDTALSCITNNGDIYRIKDKVCEKLQLIGKDAVFICGYGNALQDMELLLPNFVDENQYLDVASLQTHLQQNYPLAKNKFKEYKIDQIDIVIFSTRNGCSESYGLLQMDNFKCRYDNASDGTKGVFSFGYDSHLFQVQAMKEFITKQTKELKVSDVYEKLYSEITGGEIALYTFDNCGLTFHGKYKLKEKGLNYSTAAMFNKLCLNVEYEDITAAY